MSTYVRAADLSVGDRFAWEGEDWEVNSKSTGHNGQVEIVARRLGDSYLERRHYFDPAQSIYMILTAAQWQQDKDDYHSTIGDDIDTQIQNKYERGLGQ